MEITIYSTLIWLTAIIVGSLGLVIYFGSNTNSSRAFAHSLFWVTMWVTSVGIFVASREYSLTLFFSRMTFVMSSTVAITFFYFFLTYPDNFKPKPIIAWILIASETFLVYIFMFTDKLIEKLILISAPHPWGWCFGSLSYIFEIYFFGFFAAGILILFNKYKTCTNNKIKTNLKYMLWAIIIGIVPSSIICDILPRFNYYHINWIGPITEIIWIPIISYSILKHQQMNVRTVATEVLAIGMTVIFFLNIFIDISFGVWGKIATFFVFLILAIYLFRGIIIEAKQREELRDLNETLADKVREQTREIQEAYEAERSARRDLEKLNETKDQFIMLTQHHIRMPVSRIGTFAAEALTNSYGVTNEKMHVALSEMSASVERLMGMVNDFLGITTITAQSSILTKTTASLKPIVAKILDELHADVKKADIKTEMRNDQSDWPEIAIDTHKMYEALLVIIENAVKYNIHGGTINIGSEVKGGHQQIIIANTGFGFTDEERSKVFGKHFYRGTEAKMKNPIGMGVGLTIARTIIRAHHGDLVINSKGRDMGAEVKVILPL